MLTCLSDLFNTLFCGTNAILETLVREFVGLTLFSLWIFDRGILEFYLVRLCAERIFDLSQ